MHHSFLCPGGQVEKQVGGVTSGVQYRDLDSYSLETTLQLLEDLDISPDQFNEAVWSDIFSQVEYEVALSGSSSSDADSEAGSHIIGGVYTYKI